MDLNESDDVELMEQGEDQISDRNFNIAVEGQKRSSVTAQAKPEDSSSEKEQSEAITTSQENTSRDSADMLQTPSQSSGEASGLQGENDAKKIWSDDRRAFLKDGMGSDEELIELDIIMRKAERIVGGQCDVVVVFALLEKACNLAVRILRPPKPFQTLEFACVLLNKYFATITELDTPKSKESNVILGILEGFQKHTENLEGVEQKKKVQMSVTFYLHSSSYLHAISLYGRSYDNAKKARKILEQNFKQRFKRMSLFGQASFHIARYNFVLKNQDISDMVLKQSFDAYFSVHSSSFSNSTSLIELYCFPLNVHRRYEGMLTKTVLKHISTKLETRSKLALSPHEKFFNVSVRLWLSSSLDKNRSQTFRKSQRTLLQLDFVIPPSEISPSVACVLRTLVEEKLLPNDIEFRKRVFNHFKDLCLQENDLYKKTFQLNILPLLIIKSENISVVSSNYLDIYKSVLSEMSKGPMNSDCAWMHERLCNVHIYTSYLYMDIVDYENSHSHAFKVIELISRYRGKYDENLQVLEAIAQYICAFVYYNKKEFKKAQEHLDNEFLLLQVVQPNYSKRLQVVQEHRAFMAQRETAISVPTGLVEIAKVFPDPKHYERYAFKEVFKFFETTPL